MSEKPQPVYDKLYWKLRRCLWKGHETEDDECYYCGAKV